MKIWCVLFLYLAKSFATTSPTVVDLTLTGNANLAAQIKAQVCAGLMNRDVSVAGSAYMLFNQYDVEWLADETGNTNPETTDISGFFKTCVGASSVAGYIRYNATSQAVIVPNLFTLAAMLNAIPMEDGDPLIAEEGLTLVFDALTEFDGFNSLNITKYMFEHYGSKTSSLAMMNPGYDQGVAHRHPFNPPLNGSPNVRLVDYIVKEKLFNFYFIDGCIRGSEEYKYLDYMVTSDDTTWLKPVPVYGYNDAFPIAGDIFEAQTNCNSDHNMGEISTWGVGNLGYFSMQTPAITEPLLQNLPMAKKPESESEYKVYNESLTYFSIIVGDGDSFNHLRESRRDWMLERVSRCLNMTASSGEECFPLVWSLSPQLTHVAPEWARWFFNQSYQTGSDYFMLPPSGDLYSYPGAMPADMQENYVINTELDCTLFNTSGTVQWEWFGTWTRAITKFMPQYTKNGVVKGIFPVNVPFLFPMLEGHWKKGEHFQIITSDDNDGKVVLFKPREWRGTTCGFACSSTADLAKLISSYERGSVASMYLTQDGGASMDNIFDIVSQLDDHVRMVDQETLVAMALQKGS